MPRMSILYRGVALALLLALIQQLGVCPCHCAEHSYWRMLLESGHGGETAGSEVETGGSEVETGRVTALSPAGVPPGNVWSAGDDARGGWDHACDSRPVEVYLREGSGSHSRPDRGPAASGTPGDALSMAQPARASLNHAFAFEAPAATPRSLRAQLQRFLL